MNPLRPTLGLASSLRTLRFPSTTRQIGQLKPFSSSTTQTFRSSALWSKRLTAVGLGSAAGLGLYAMAPTSSFSSFSPVRMAECECKSIVCPFLLSPLPDGELITLSFKIHSLPDPSKPSSGRSSHGIHLVSFPTHLRRSLWDLRWSVCEEGCQVGRFHPRSRLRLDAGESSPSSPSFIYSGLERYDNPADD